MGIEKRKRCLGMLPTDISVPNLLFIHSPQASDKILYWRANSKTFFYGNESDGGYSRRDISLFLEFPFELFDSIRKRIKVKSATMNRHTTIQEYFAKRARCYKEAYGSEKSRGFLNSYYQIAWFPLRSIFRYTMEYLAAINPQRVLDIGCGTGVYVAALAERGIAVTGLDSCKEMIDATENLLKDSGLNTSAKTVLADYLEWSGKTEQKYDLALAIGVVDYVDDAAVYLASFKHVAREVIVTFPAKYDVFFYGRFQLPSAGDSRVLI